MSREQYDEHKAHEKHITLDGMPNIVRQGGQFYFEGGTPVGKNIGDIPEGPREIVARNLGLDPTMQYHDMGARPSVFEEKAKAKKEAKAEV